MPIEMIFDRLGSRIDNVTSTDDNIIILEVSNLNVQLGDTILMLNNTEQRTLLISPGNRGIFNVWRFC